VPELLEKQGVYLVPGVLDGERVGKRQMERGVLKNG